MEELSTLDLWDKSETQQQQSILLRRAYDFTLNQLASRWVDAHHGTHPSTSRFSTSLYKSVRNTTVLYRFEWYQGRLLSFCRYVSIPIGKEFRSPGSDKYHSGPGIYGPETRLMESCLLTIHDWRNRDVIFIMARYNTFEQGVTAV